jgi:hypothetical protein
VVINRLVADSAILPFRIALFSFFGLLGLLFGVPIFEAATGRALSIGPMLAQKESGTFSLLVASYFPHLVLFVVTLASAYVGYKLVVASGASPENPIPPANYRLLAPLIADGKAESIDQYVRLSSLSGFTGTFTKLGLTGLPLTTVALTLFFAIITLFPIDGEAKKNFMDLTKLVLGAFIGSFVQRQVEQRKASNEDKQKFNPTDQSVPSRSS